MALNENRTEQYLAALAGEGEAPTDPRTRLERYLSYFAGLSEEKPTNPENRIEMFLDLIEAGGDTPGVLISDAEFPIDGSATGYTSRIIIPKKAIYGEDGTFKPAIIIGMLRSVSVLENDVIVDRGKIDFTGVTLDSDPRVPLFWSFAPNYLDYGDIIDFGGVSHSGAGVETWSERSSFISSVNPKNGSRYGSSFALTGITDISPDYVFLTGFTKCQTWEKDSWRANYIIVTIDMTAVKEGREENE